MTQTVAMPSPVLGPTERPRRVRWPLVAIAVALILVAIAATAYLSLRPIATDVRFAALTDTTVASGQSVRVEGTVRPAEEVRLVILEERTPEGTWVATGKATQTDGEGRFALSIDVEGGSHEVRVVAEGFDRLQPAASRPLTLLGLAPSTVTAKAGAVVKKGENIRVDGVVAPPVAGRALTLEGSSDGSTWVPAGAETTSAADGAFALEVAASSVGSMQYRATAAADNTHGAASSPPVTVAVEDFAAAGQHYLASVEPANKAGDAWNAVLDKADPTLAELKSTGKSYAAATKAMTDAISSYPAWPSAVKPLIDVFVDGNTADYGRINELANADSVDEYYRWLNDMPDVDYLGDNAEQIRQKLGLPARD